jgi:hypothetical protein
MYRMFRYNQGDVVLRVCTGRGRAISSAREVWQMPAKGASDALTPSGAGGRVRVGPEYCPGAIYFAAPTPAGAPLVQVTCAVFNGTTDSAILLEPCCTSREWDR